MVGESARSGSPKRMLAMAAIVVTLALSIGALPAQPAPAAGITPTLVLGWSPGVGHNLSPRTPITVYFNRPMNRTAVQLAWRMTPAIAGALTGSATAFTFTPSAPLPPGKQYRLTIGTGALAANGMPLSSPFSTAFTVGDALRVRTYSPLNGTRGVPPTGLISVTFNHPMAPLAGLDVPAGNPRGWRLTISPRIAGYGSWLGTSTWVFHPTGGLEPSTRYTVRLAGSVQDGWAERLGGDRQWSFSTITPEVYSRTPRNGEQFVDPQASIRVTFNQPMNHASAAHTFSLLTAGRAVSGSITWQGDTLVFRPHAALDSSKKYRVTEYASARSANGRARGDGGAALPKSVRWSFQAAPPPRLVGANPEENGTVYSGVSGWYGAQPPEAYDAALIFNTPMNPASLDRHLTVSPSVSHLNTNFYGPDSSGRWQYSIGGDFNPSSSYTVALSTGVVDRFGRPLAGSPVLHFQTAPMAPSVALYGVPGAAQGVSVSAGTVIQAPVQIINVPRVRYILVRTTLQAVNNNCCGPGLTIPAGQGVRTWWQDEPHPLNKIENLRLSLAAPDGSPLAPGLYWLGAETANDIPGLPPDTTYPPQSEEIVVVTDESLTLKTGQNETLVWANSTKTGEPAAGLPVQLVNYQGGVLQSGTTNSKGVHVFHRTASEGQPTAIADAHGHFGLAEAGWTPNTPGQSGPFPFGTYSGLASGPFFGRYYVPSSGGTYLYTDRPIYRPGQRVYFRGVLWRDNDGVYSRFGPSTAVLRATDANNRSLYWTKVKVDRFGAVHGSFMLPPHTPTGQDSISINIVRSVGTQTSFTVAEYRKPEFLASVSTRRPAFVRGQTLFASAQVRYVFGAPVIHQQVSWVAYTQPRIPQPPGWDAYTFFDWESFWNQNFSPTGQGQSQFGKVVAQGSGRTDGKGRLAFTVPLDLARQRFDRNVTIEVTASDVNHQSVSARTELPAYHSDLAIGLDAVSDVVAAGQPAAVDVVAVKQDGSAVPGQVLTVHIFKRTYTNKLIRVGPQQTQWQAVAHDAPVQSQTLTTDTHGKARIVFTPDGGGEYRLVVTGKDELGNPTSTAISVDASTAGSADWGLTTDTSLALKADRSTYQVGDTAHILVPAPFDNASALVTVERGNIRRHWVLHLATNSSTVDVPVTLDDLPNVYVTVTLYRGWRGSSPPDWRYGTTELHVRLDPRHLVVHLAQNGFRHHPGDPVTYTVTTTDAHGHPVSAQVSLALVDTAVLALQDETNAGILQAFYAEQPSGVTTQSDGVLSIDRLQVKPNFPIAGFNSSPRFGAAPAPVEAGGGGGKQAAGPAIAVRSNFADTAYWSAGITTNSAGRATVRVKLPDNATTWRLDARGLTVNQSVGQAELRTLASQDLVLRPVLPRFLVEGDRLRIGTVLNNNLSRTVRARISISAGGLAIPRRTYTVSVPARGERLVTWPASVPVGESAQITVYAASLTTGVRGDAVRLGLPVYPPLTGETVASAGQVYGASRELVILPRNAVSRPGALTVDVSASLTAGLGAAYTDFRPASTESNDDVANRLLVAAALRSLPASITGLTAGTYRRLPLVMAAGVQKLLDDQLPDGGWPWYSGPWEYSDPDITAAAIRALAASGEHRQEVRVAIDRGRSFIRGEAQGAPLGGFAGPLPQSERTALMLALAESGRAPRRLAEALYNNSIQRSHLVNGALADLGLTLALGHDTAHARSIASVLDGNAMISATGAHWESDIRDVWSDSAIGTTTQVLNALLTIEPHDAFVPAAVRWLMLARQGTHWDCPRDSADTIAALARYARAAKEGNADYHYQIAVDGITRLAGWYGGDKQTPGASTKIPVARLRRNRPSSVVIGRENPDGSSGAGPLYYVTQLRYYLPAASIAPMAEGVAVSRRFLSLNGRPIDRIAAGSAFQVDLTIHTDQTLLYLDVEDPLAVGCEAIDGSLNTSQQGLFKPPIWWWQPWPGGHPGSQDLTPYLIHTDLHDDRVSLYSYFLPPGTYQYTYLAQGTVPGHYGVPPTHTAETFFPEVFGRSAGQTFVVTG